MNGGGGVWLWVGGLVVGDPNEIEMILIGLDSLQEAAHEDRTETSSSLANLTQREVLDIVMWSRYEDGPCPVKGITLGEDALSSLEILPRRTGPLFDGWEAALIDRGAGEEFIYRHVDGDVLEAVWPLGTYKAVIDEARVEFENFARLAFEASAGRIRHC